MTADELRDARRQLGLGQRDLARRLGVPHTTLWRWETGKHPIQHPTILKLALMTLGTYKPIWGARYDPNEDDSPDF